LLYFEKDAASDYLEKYEQYWNQVEEHVNKLEGKVNKINEDDRNNIQLPSDVEIFIVHPPALADIQQ